MAARRWVLNIGTSRAISSKNIEVLLFCGEGWGWGREFCGGNTDGTGVLGVPAADADVVRHDRGAGAGGGGGGVRRGGADGSPGAARADVGGHVRRDDGGGGRRGGDRAAE